MDQKNTNNSKGICDSYEIDINPNTNTEKNIKRGQRLKGNFFEDCWLDQSIVEDVCKPLIMGVDLSNE